MIDGDTFYADFNRNGRFSNPQEGVRLLYVDTPELKKSHKGKDPKLGLPAKGFLKSVLLKTKWATMGGALRCWKSRDIIYN